MKGKESNFSETLLDSFSSLWSFISSSAPRRNACQSCTGVCSQEGASAVLGVNGTRGVRPLTGCRKGQ